MPLFSRRNEPVRDSYRYTIPENVRTRLLQTIRLCLERPGARRSYTKVIREMRDTILQRYGGFRSSGYEAARMSDDVVIDHFYRCTGEEVMDFLQMCFETRGNCGGQPTIDEINRVLDEEGIGYELTPLREEIVSEFIPDGRPLYGPGTTYRTVPPTVIRKDEEVQHAQSVKPCLKALFDPRFATANGELMNAFDEHRKGKYGDAVTDAGAAFESVLKTICALKGWTYDKDRDTCSKLLDICRAQGLFHPFYRQILEGTATIRNKIGDAHGKGPRPEYPATKELADHMLYTVCNNINLLIGLARL